MIFFKIRAPEAIRTPGHLLRRQVLYPAELRARRRKIPVELLLLHKGKPNGFPVSSSAPMNIGA